MAQQTPRSGTTLGELIDLALSSTDVGAVNFNILRILLRDIVEKTGIDKKPAKVSDVEAGQVENYKNYVQGSGAVTPGPGVLKIGPGRTSGGSEAAAPAAGGGGTGNSAPQNQQRPSQDSSSGQSPPNQQQRPSQDSSGGQNPNQQKPPQTPKTPTPNNNSPPSPAANQPQQRQQQSQSGPGMKDFSDLADKVAKLEKHLDTLYQLPTNAEILEKAKGGGAGGATSVSDMWQIIQLNNRIAAAEAAIQKMASLIEDLAKNVGKVKSDTKVIKKDAADMHVRKSDLHIQGQELSEKCEKFGNVVNKLQKELDDVKRGWKTDRDNIEKALGTSLGKVPSFIKQKQQPQQQQQQTQTKQRAPSEDRGSGGNSAAHGTPSEQFDRGTQTAKDADRSRSPGRQSGQQQQHTPARPNQNDQATATERKQPPQQKHPPPHKAPEEMLRPEEIAKMAPAEIAKQITPEEANQISPEKLNEMTPQQKQAVQEIKKAAAAEKPPRHHQDPPRLPSLGIKNMTKEEIHAVTPEKIEKMRYDEAVNLPPDVVQNMAADQKEKLQKVIDKGPPPPKKTHSRRREQQQQQTPDKPGLGVAKMTDNQIHEIPAAEIQKEMPYEEAKAIPQKLLEQMTPAQKEAVKKVVEAGPSSRAPPPQQKHRGSQQEPQRHSLPPGEQIGVASMSPQQIKEVTPSEILKEMPFEEAKSIPPNVLDKMTSAQKEAVKKVVNEGRTSDSQGHGGYDDHDDYSEGRSSRDSSKSRKSSVKEAPPKNVKPLTIEQIDSIAAIPPELLAAKLTPEAAASIPAEEMEAKFTPQQIAEITKIQKLAPAAEEGRGSVSSHPDEPHRTSVDQHSKDQDQYVDEQFDQEYQDEGDYHSGHHEEEKKRKSSFKDKPKPPPHPPQRERKTAKHHNHDGDDDLKRTQVDVIKGPIPTAADPLPPASLDEYLGALPPEEAANLAADAVQKELQKQYEHLQGMQRQLATDIQDKMEFIYQKLLKEIATQQMSTSPYMSVGGGPEECLGPGVCTGYGMPAGIAVCQFPEVKDKKAADGSVCPGSVCPTCRADGQMQDRLQNLKAPGGRKSEGEESVDGKSVEFGEALLNEMKSLMLLDLEKIRDEMRMQNAGAFDEQDILERLNAVWEALKILKNNEEALAVKIARQDAFFKKIPTKTIEKLQKVPDENLDALAKGNFQKPMYLPDDAARRSGMKELEEAFRPSTSGASPHGPHGSVAEKDVHTLFNNLANVIAECTELRDRLNHLTDTARVMESGMVTKQVLLDALNEKADKGLINTKVSYDEFGNTIDQLHTQLHNLMVEGYQRNENWKKVTTDLSEELSEKLDKLELAPMRAFFKNHIRALEDKVKELSVLVEEPDSAGTRKKLRDLNCISCDRKVNISGTTSGSTLPIIGPIPAGHQTASRRALDLHRMRMMKKFDPNTKNLNALELQKRGIQGRVGRPGSANAIAAEMANDMDVMNVVNRYSGGSHTAIANADLIAAQRRSSMVPAEQPKPIEETPDAAPTEPAVAPPADPLPPSSPQMLVVGSPSMEYMIEVEE